MKGMIIRLIFALLLAVLVLIALISAYDYAMADEYYVLCRPGAEVNVRELAKLKSPIVACVFFGQKVETDGQEKNGFVHAVGLSAETDSGWIYKGLLTKDEPISATGSAQVFGADRVACRKYADGKVKRWLTDGQNVKLYAISGEWCVTEYGYVKTAFLTVNAPVR